MAYKIHEESAAGNLYFTTNYGVMRLTDPSGFYKPAGIIQPIECDCRLVADATGITFAKNDSYAYRVIFSYIDSNDNKVVSAPSNRIVLTATALGTYRIDVTVRINGSVTTDYFFKVYRSKKRTGTAASYIDPGDELYLTYQDFFSSTAITNKKITFKDIRDDAILGEPLYTNASEQTIDYANMVPPYSRSLCWFKNHMFYFNVKLFQSRNIQLIGTSLAAADTITIAGIVYTAATTTTTDITLVQDGTSPVSEDKTTGTFVIYDLVSDITQRIEGTCRSLCRVINGNPLNTSVFAYYDSPAGGTPGIIRLVAQDYSKPAFSITVSSSAAGLNFEPILPTSGNSIISSDNEAVAGWYVSKPNEPDHVISKTFGVIGDRGEAINHAFALKDSIIVIKNGKIFRGSGNTIKDFTFTLLETSISIGNSYESCAELDNKIWALSNQGPVSISETGVELVGRAEEYNLLKGILGFDDGFSNGVGIEHRRVYAVCTYDPELKQKNIENPGSYPYPYSTFAYNYTTRSWSRWLINSNTFAVLGDQLYYGLNNNTGTIMEERLPTIPGETNYYDEKSSISIANINSTTNTADVVMTPAVDYDGYFDQFSYLNVISPGFETLSNGFLVQDGVRQYRIESYDSGTGKATFNTVAGLTNGNKDIFRPIPCIVEYTVSALDNPALMKKFREVVVIGDFTNAYKLYLDFMNQLSYKDYRHFYTWNESKVSRRTKLIGDISNKNAMQFKERFIRDQVPQEKHECAFLSLRITHITANASFVLKGVCFVVDQEDTVKIEK